MAVYTVKAGDTLGKIAAQFNISVDALLQFNPGIKDPNVIFVGQQITVPDVGPPVTPSPVPVPPEPAPPPSTSLDKVVRKFRSVIDFIVDNRPYEVKLVDGLLYIVTLDKSTYSLGEEVKVTLYKLNVTDDSIKLRYNTGQRMDLVVRTASGKEVWKYSRGLLFTQQSATVTIRTNAYAIYKNEWDQEDNKGRQVSDGRYIMEVYNVARGLEDEAISIDFRIREDEVRPTIPPEPFKCTGENLLRNSDFESWYGSTNPKYWNATNVRRTNISYTGNNAVEMGSDPARRSTLSQEFAIAPDSNNRVSFRVAEDVEGSKVGNFNFGVQVFFRNREGTVVGVAPQGPYSPEIIEDEEYEQFTFTTGKVPSSAVTAELIFTFTPRTSNRSRIRIDSAEFRCLNL